jgi:hypothetical protein
MVARLEVSGVLGRPVGAALGVAEAEEPEAGDVGAEGMAEAPEAGALGLAEALPDGVGVVGVPGQPASTATDIVAATTTAACMKFFDAIFERSPSG